jgi:hypothetical protein
MNEAYLHSVAPFLSMKDRKLNETVNENPGTRSFLMVLRTWSI